MYVYRCMVDKNKAMGGVGGGQKRGNGNGRGKWGGRGQLEAEMNFL